MKFEFSPQKSGRKGGREPCFALKFGLNFAVLIQPYLSGLKIAFEEEAELDSQNQNIIGHEKLTKPTVPNVLYYYHSLRRGPTGPSSLAPATQDKMHPFIIIQWS